MDIIKKRKKFFALYIVGVFVTVGIIFFGMFYGIKYLAQRNLYQKVTLISDGFVRSLLDQAGAIYSAQAVFSSPNQLSETAWQDFAYSQALFQRYNDLQTVAFIEIVPDNQRSEYLRRISSDPLLIKPADFGIKPVTSPASAPITYTVTPDTDHHPVTYSGANLFSDPSRKTTFETASKSREATLSPPLRGLSGPGDLLFFITLPIYTNTDTNFGYANATFQIEKLINKIIGEQLKSTKVELKIEDITDGQKTFAYQSPDFDKVSNPIYAESVVQILNRKWLMTYKASVYSQVPPVAPIIPFTASTIILILLLQPQIYKWVKRRSLKSRALQEKPTQTPGGNKPHSPQNNKHRK